MPGIWMVCQFMWLNHLNRGHPYCSVFRWIQYSGVWYSDGYCIFCQKLIFVFFSRWHIKYSIHIAEGKQNKFKFSFSDWLVCMVFYFSVSLIRLFLFVLLLLLYLQDKLFEFWVVSTVIYGILFARFRTVECIPTICSFLLWRHSCSKKLFWEMCLLDIKCT